MDIGYDDTKSSSKLAPTIPTLGPSHSIRTNGRVPIFIGVIVLCAMTKPHYVTSSGLSLSRMRIPYL